MRYRLLLPFLLCCHLIVAEQTGPNYAGTVGVSGVGTAWTNTTNAQGSTADNYSTVSLTGNGTQSEYLTFTNFGLNIPSGYKVDGITVEIRWRRSGSNTTEDNEVRLMNGGVITGNNNGLDNDLPTTTTIATYGSTTDTWGLSFNESEIEATNFGVAIKLDKQGGGGTSVGEVDWVRVTVISSFVLSVSGAESDRQVTVGGTNNSWAPLANLVSASDGLYENVLLTKGQNSQYLIIDNWNLSIGTVNEILGITVTFERKQDAGAKIQDYFIYLVDETGAIRASVNKANTGVDWPTTDAAASYGGSTDLWGEAAGFWTPAKLNDPDWGVAIAVIWANQGPSPGSRYASIDNVSLSINYSIPLPVELTKFEGNYKNGSVNLTWQTANEINNDFFEVQRASVASDFGTIGQVAGNGNSETTIDYTFVDQNPATGINYYRLKQVDFDGRFEYSPIVVINTSSSVTPHFNIFPNPVDQYLNLSSNVPLSGSNLQVYNLAGTEVRVNILDSKRIDVSGLSQGLYIMKIQTPAEVFDLKFVKK